MDCGPPGSSVHGNFQARVLDCVAISFSRGSFWPRVWMHLLHWQAASLPLSHQGSPFYCLSAIKKLHKLTSPQEQAHAHFLLGDLPNPLPQLWLFHHSVSITSQICFACALIFLNYILSLPLCCILYEDEGQCFIMFSKCYFFFLWKISNSKKFSNFLFISLTYCSFLFLDILYI